MMLKMENLPLLYQFLPTFWCDRFDKMVEEVAGSAVFHSFSFFFGHIFPKMRPYLFIGFLIVSAGFLILLAGALIVSADAIRIFALRKAEWFAPSILCEDLWLSWEEKSEKIIDIFKPPPPPPSGGVLSFGSRTGQTGQTCRRTKAEKAEIQ